MVEGALNGDIESFGELYQRHYAGVVSVAYSMLMNRHMAEDAAQESFAIACRKLGGLRRPEKFAAWLRGICRNVSKTLLRSEAKHTAVRECAVGSRDCPDCDRDEAVRYAVSRLRPPSREVIVLHYFGGLTHKEIGRMLRISPEAVHGRLVRARRDAAKYLEHSVSLEKRL